MATATKSRKKSSGSKKRSSGRSRSRSRGSGKTAAQVAAGSKVDPLSPLAATPDVRVDSTSARTDDDVYFGHFCTVVAGEHEGRYGVYEANASIGSDGYPEEVIVRTRDDATENLRVKYADIRPAAAGRR